MSNIQADKIRSAIDIARKQYAIPSNDDIEIDDNPKTCASDHGIWVAAWVHVHQYEIDEAHEADELGAGGG
jgi:hypothetical protein